MARQGALPPELGLGFLFLAWSYTWRVSSSCLGLALGLSLPASLSCREQGLGALKLILGQENSESQNKGGLRVSNRGHSIFWENSIL